MDLVLKKHLNKCVAWSKISKQDYLNAMMLSTTNSSILKTLLERALSALIDDRDVFMRGIDYSYYYEEGE